MIKSLLAGIPVIGPIINIVPDFVWQGLAIFAVLAAIYGAGDYHGTHRERAKCQAAAEAARQKASEQDTKAQTITTEDENRVNTDLVTQEEADKRARDAVDKAIEKYRLENPPAKGAKPCRSTLTDDDVRGLRN